MEKDPSSASRARARRRALAAALSLPTAPFHEAAVAGWVRSFADRLGLPVSADRAGNLYVRYRRGAPRGTPWVLAAHMDHPGFVVEERRGRRVRARFMGGVELACFRPGTGVLLFTPEGPLRARLVSAAAPKGAWHKDCRLELAEPAVVPPGTIGMWDVPCGRSRSGVVSARGCDDVAGVAAALLALEELVAAGARADVIALFTRAEEVGFIGAVAAVQEGLLPPGARVVSIETSKEQPTARLGDGVVVRVGDKAWTFEPELTGDLRVVADELAARDRSFRYVRQLMPGGTCEASVYALHGLRAAAVCVPLGNYHNQAPGSRVGPERIHVRDFEALVTLLVAAVTSARTSADAARSLRRTWRERFRARRGWLCDR